MEGSDGVDIDAMVGWKIASIGVRKIRSERL